MIPKFRAWVKPGVLSNHLDGVIAEAKPDFIERVCLVKRDDLIGNECFDEIFDFEDVILMQSTGLKDKNGVEIFEGDIVSVEDHPFQKTKDSVVGVQIDGNYEIGWNEHDMTWCAGSLLLARLKPYVAVVGNIHANPEMLS